MLRFSISSFSALLPLWLLSGVRTEGTITLQNADLSDCTKGKDVNETLYTGWPHAYSCQALAEEFIDKYINTDRNITRLESFNGLNASCIVRDMETGINLWNASMFGEIWYRYRFENPDYYTPDTKSNDSKLYRIIFHMPASNYCSYQEVNRNIKPHQDETCEEFLSNGPLGKADGILGGVTSIPCYGENDRKPNFADEHSRFVEYEFFQNCSKSLPKNLRLDGNKAILHNISFANGGFYTCAVTYKGQKRYLMNFRSCNSYPKSSYYTLTCPEVVEANLGNDVNITCTADLGTGIPSLFLSTSFWYELTTGEKKTKICESLALEYINSYQPNAACMMRREFINEEASCFMAQPTGDQIPRASVQVILTLKNLNASDFKTYSVLFWKEKSFWSPQPPKIRNITLVLNKDRELKKDSAAIMVAIVVASFLIVFLLLVLWRKHDILWCSKKYFGGYEKDPLPFAAYLAYYYSNDTDNMSETSRKLTESLVDSMYSMFDSIGCSVYDDHRDESHTAFEIDNIAKRQGDCDRIIIVLNPEYVTDHWSVHKAYRALQNMVETGAKLIFITIPGTQNSLMELPSGSKTTLKRAMQRNTTIPWTGKTSGSFRRRLEYALPKLRRNAAHDEQANML